MSRFHDEFFKQGSPKHDALMIKCLSKKGLDKICDQLNVFGSLVGAYGSPMPVMICKRSNGGRCVRLGTVEKFIASREYGEHEKYCTLANSYSDGCLSQRECAFNEDRSLLPIDAFAQPTASIDVAVQKKETEAIMRNGTFIIGYADAIIDIGCEISVDLKIDDDWIWKKAINRVDEAKILIEAKPTLDSIGEVIRQLKTYKSCIEMMQGHYFKIFPVIVTYTKIKDDALDYLSNEHISVVVFEEGA